MQSVFFLIFSFKMSKSAGCSWYLFFRCHSILCQTTIKTIINFNIYIKNILPIISLRQFILRYRNYKKAVIVVLLITLLWLNDVTLKWTNLGVMLKLLGLVCSFERKWYLELIYKWNKRNIINSNVNKLSDKRTIKTWKHSVQHIF